MDLFISDLHLAESRPAANEAFFAFIEGKARSAESLYILGDLFEYWVGDDDLADPFNGVVAGFLRELSRSGVKLGVMQGNRDFLYGPAFGNATGAALLPDPLVLELGGRRALLMHGDTLCTRDTDYQEWRRKVHSEAFQRDFLAKPLAARRELAADAREKSAVAKGAKAMEIMDVDAEAVREALRRHGATLLIHGHTHRPGRHELEVDGRRCERWVLPDWYGAGGYLELAGAKPRLVRFQA
ncbi:MAG TPA: UDP-2,3-diacylglucosamine diphosphatase [Burkholderiales bacterium]|nr:UDP-2,3-diacylglucosamine diphosphatase [Burkholderiales bacterium]